MFLLTACWGNSKKPIVVDSKGRVLKTFDGHLYNVFDTLGRLTEVYGYADYDDWKGCVHDKIFYDNDGNVSFRVLYNFSNEDTLHCLVMDTADYRKYVYHYSEEGELLRQDTYVPLKENGLVKGYKLARKDSYNH